MTSKKGPERQNTFLQDWRIWSSLPSLILDSTLERLPSIHDYIRFGFVCKHWRKVALDQKSQHLESSLKQLAPLMLLHRVPPANTFISYERRRELYDVTQGKVVRSFNVPYYRDDEDPPRLCGSSHGWLGYVDAGFAITLLNPFTNESIRLPCIPTLHIKKVVLSASPSLFPNEYQVLVIFEKYDVKLAHLKAGDEDWTRFDNRMMKDFDIVDAIYHEGRFLALNGRFYRNHEVESRVLRKVHPSIECISRPKQQHYYMALSLLVKSTCGDVLLVDGDTNMFSSKNGSRIFKLASLAGDGGSSEWAETKSLGNDALFVDKMSAVCSCVSESSSSSGRFDPNTMNYLMEDVINLSSGKRSKRHCVIPKRTRPRPITWVTPTLEFSI